MKNDPLSSASTRDRILEAAGEVFAQFGFQKSTVRKISKRAGVNLASINYHFGEKEKLYFEVLKYGHEVSMKKYPLSFGLSQGISPEERLQNFIRLFLFRMLGKGKPAWYGKLMAKEMTEPTQAFDRLVKQIIRPLSNLLASVVQELVESQMDQDQIRLCCLSIIGQCLHYNNARPAVTRFFERNIYTSEGIEQITKHITQFSLNGLKHFGETKNEKNETKIIISNN
jgi:AcrR family transcriptional regulator